MIVSRHVVFVVAVVGFIVEYGGASVNARIAASSLPTPSSRLVTLHNVEICDRLSEEFKICCRRVVEDMPVFYSISFFITTSKHRDNRRVH